MRRIGVAKLLIVIFGIFLSYSAVAETQSERVVVNQAIDAIDICYHWAGEGGDQSDERNRDIQNGLDTDCPVAKKLTIQAFRKYPRNSRLYEPILRLSEIHFFTLSVEDRTRLCAASSSSYSCTDE